MSEDNLRRSYKCLFSGLYKWETPGLKPLRQSRGFGTDYGIFWVYLYIFFRATLVWRREMYIGNFCRIKDTARIQKQLWGSYCCSIYQFLLLIWCLQQTDQSTHTSTTNRVQKVQARQLCWEKASTIICGKKREVIQVNLQTP